MLEQFLMLGQVSAPIVRQDALFIDMATAKETVSNKTITLSAGAAINNTNLINNRPTMSLPTAGGSGSRLLMSSSPGMNMGYGWTLEWSHEYISAPIAWTNEVYFCDSTVYKGITIRWGNTGYNSYLMFSDNNNLGVNKSECRFEVLPADVAGKIVHWAMTCDNLGRIRLYKNGTLVRAVAGASGGAWAPYYQSGPVTNYDALTTLYLGAYNANANNVNRRAGNLRISRPALYTGGSYTLVPF